MVISAWSDMSWMQLWANLRSVAMPPRLSDTDKKVPALPLIVAFKVPLILHNAAGQEMGDYMLKKSGDPQLYPGTFEWMPGYIELQRLTMTQQAWTDWAILQDLHEEASVSVAELMPETPWDLEPGEIDDESVAGSVTSQKHDEVVHDQLLRGAQI